MTDRLCKFISSFRPAKVKVDELVCWHIERRAEPKHHVLTHCHEYNFAGKISIIPRVRAVVTAFYLELRTGRGLLVDSSQYPGLSKIAPDEPVAKMCRFQVRLSDEIKVPSHGYIVLKFNRGVAKKKVTIKLDDEYRPKIWGE